MSYVVLIAMLLMGQLAYAAEPVFGTASEARFARDLRTPKGKSLIYIYMRKQDADIASPKIWLNNYEIGRLVPGSFTVWQLAPGQLNLRVGSRHPATISVRSVAGSVYLFRISAKQTSDGIQAQIENLPDTYRGDLAATRLIKNPRQVTAAVIQAPAKTTQAPVALPPSTKQKPETKPRHEKVHNVHVTQHPGGYGVMLKLGSLSISNQTQTILGSDRTFDKSASGVFGIEVYKQSVSGFAWGGELVTYKSHFNTVGGGSSGDVTATVGLANAKQYYRTDTNLQPYLGVGAGYAVTSSSGSAFTGSTAGFAYQVVGGVEYRTGTMGYFAEAKYLGAKTKDKDSNTIDVTGTGFFAGLALHF